MALAWPNHIHHGRAVAWFREHREHGWATCPLTEAGFVRVSSNTRAIPEARTPQDAIALLRRLCAVPGHTFWNDDVSASQEGPSPFDAVVGYRQVTDAHLITLCIRRSGRLATFDQALVSLVPGQEDVVELIA